MLRHYSSRVKKMKERKKMKNLQEDHALSLSEVSLDAHKLSRQEGKKRELD